MKVALLYFHLSVSLPVGLFISPSGFSAVVTTKLAEYPVDDFSAFVLYL